MSNKNRCKSMKNLDGKGILCRFLTLKNVRAMKIALILLSAMLFRVSATEVYSQEISINLNMNNSTVKEVLKEIENRSDFTFYYNDDFFIFHKRARIHGISHFLSFLTLVIVPKTTTRYTMKTITRTKTGPV